MDIWGEVGFDETGGNAVEWKWIGGLYHLEQTCVQQEGYSCFAYYPVDVSFFGDY